MIRLADLIILSHLNWPVTAGTIQLCLRFSNAGTKRSAAEISVIEQQNDYSRNRAAAYRMLAVEAGITAALALVLFLTAGGVTARSSLLGGLTFILPNALFVRYVFRQSAAVSASTAVRWLYVGEAIKLATTLLMFAACFMWIKPLSAGVYIGTFAGMIVVNMAGNAYLTKS